MKQFYLVLAAGIVSVLPSAAVEVGSSVNLDDNLCGRVLSVNGNNHKVEVYGNPDAMPTGILEIHNTYFIGDDTFTVTRIAPKAFAYSELTYVGIGTDVTSIGERAFNGCTKLKAFKEAQRGGVKTIGDEAFAYTYALKELSLPGVTTVGEFAFRASKIVKVDMPAVEYIYAGAFQECEYLEEFNGGDKLITVGNIAFTKCKNLKYITHGSSLGTIGSMAFAFCENLDQVVIPSSLTDMGRDAFQGCGLKRVFILADSFMNYCDAGKLLRNKSITAVYCVEPIVGAVQQYLAEGSGTNPVESLTDAPVASMDMVVSLQHDEAMGQDMYKAEQKLGGITDLQLFDAVTGEEIVGDNGFYHIDKDRVRLLYRVDTVNLLDYTTGIAASSGIEALPVDDVEAGVCWYTLSGVRVARPVSGPYIRVSSGKARKVML